MLSLLSATLESSADGILVADLSGNLVHCNRKFAEMWGLPPEGAEDREARVAFARSQVKDPEGFADRIRAVYASPEADSIDVIELKDGRVFERYSIPQRFDGHVIGRVTHFRDVTAYRRAGEALQRALAWQEAVFEGSRDAVFVSDAGSRFVMVNSAAERLTGYTREELRGMRIPDLHDPSDLAAYRQYHDPIMAGMEHVTEALVRRKDGTKIPVEFNNRRITCDGASFMHSVARDITERRAAAAQLEYHVRRSAALSRLGQMALERSPLSTLLAQTAATAADLLTVEYAAVMELLPGRDHLLLVAGAGWQPGAVGTVRIPAGGESLAGHTLRAEGPVIVPDLAAETRFSVQPHLRGHGVRSAMAVTVAGRHSPYGVLAAYSRRPREFTGADVHFLSVLANVIAQAIIRHREEQTLTTLIHRLISAQEEERRSLARELHDETGQALTSVLVGLRALEGAATPGTEAATAHQVREVAKQALENVSRLSQGLRPSVLDDLGLVPALSRYVNDYAAIHGLAVEIDIRGFDGRRLPATIEITLYRIVQEALTNVARHASAKRVKLSLSRPSGLVCLVVEDDGRGFDLPGRGDLPALDGRLGLLGIRERAALLNGTAEVRSVPGRGTTVRVTIPVED